ncbi:unnamed protein product [Closterium sp. Naga37s-1]|nr:unnamed protein product [Closterium sp. Naga37s-1]
MEVIRCEDRELIPLPPPDLLRNYTARADRGGIDRSDLKPIRIEQPEGPSFRVNGYTVEWQKGPSFRVNGYAVEWQKVGGGGFMPREGLVLHSLAYDDGSSGRRGISSQFPSLPSLSYPHLLPHPRPRPHPFNLQWSFRVGFTPKEGRVPHSLAYNDGSSDRRGIAHWLSVCEMVVPYGDPHEPHYCKNAFDAGEDGLGKNAHSLKKGCDCLAFIPYFDTHMRNFIGGVETIEKGLSHAPPPYPH